MPKTLLAIDDSVTMRRVVEMTFAGEDVRVVTAASAQEALGAIRRDQPDIVLADVALDGHSGYDLCRAIKDEFRGIPVILLSSKQNPFDPARGQAAGADDHIDKPYDTAKAIELVKRILSQGKSVAPAPIAAAAAPGVPAAPRTPMFSPAAQPAPPAPPPAAAIAMPPAQSPHPTMQGMPAQGRAPAQPPAKPAVTPTGTKPALQAQPTPALHAPALKPQQTVRMTSDSPPAADVRHGTLAELAQGGGNGTAPLPAELAGKLPALGLTPAQVDAVVALSREVVERVVWEVVPVLAETMVREEIARLTRE